MEGIYGLVAYAGIATLIVETIKVYFTSQTENKAIKVFVTVLLPVFLGLAFAIFGNIDVFYILGLEMSNVYISYGVTAFFIGAGSNKFYDLLLLIKENRKNIEGLTEDNTKED